MDKGRCSHVNADESAVDSLALSMKRKAAARLRPLASPCCASASSLPAVLVVSIQPRARLSCF